MFVRWELYSVINMKRDPLNVVLEMGSVIHFR